ncbi:probable inactive DNA (cytosine-5)-methyltransferase DRM3 [Primulina eburnea]|uniref:probable inactive DNA (cytosine-5)-methyltransferase DRM3 n=1 Tax=Primulina eburnea TaxID=1245227 RepID=UPI003C6BFA8E
MCEVVEISDEEGSLVPDNDVGIKPKDEVLDYDLPLPKICPQHGVDNEASSSQSNLRTAFVGMGFTPSLVDKAIKENGEGNTDLLLETLFAYSALHKPESPDSLDSFFDEDTKNNACSDRAFPLKEEPDVCSGYADEKIVSLLKMNFLIEEVRFAMDKLGEDASIGQLMDFIFAARMAKKYEKLARVSVSGDEDSNEECSNEALFGIMEKTLRLLEIGFSEQEISIAFEKCGSNASLQELTDSIFGVQLSGSCPNSDKYSSTSLSTSTTQINPKTLHSGLGGYLCNKSFDSITVKTEECGPDAAARVGISDLLEKLKGKRPKEEDTENSNNWKKLKEEFTEGSSDSVGRMLVEARRRNPNSTSNRVPVLQRQFNSMGSLEEDIKPPMLIPRPCKTLTSVVAKSPYFLYGNVTNLSHDSWAKLSQFLYSVQPEFVNTEMRSALSRKEGYIHNLPTEDRFYSFPKSPMTIQEAIPHTRKWWPLWDTRKQLSNISCETSGISQLCDRFGRMLTESKGLLTDAQRRDLLQQCQALNLVWLGNYKLAPIEPEHLEHIMGYPTHHTQAAGFSLSDRLKSLKLAFQTDTLAYHLSVLKPLFPGGMTVLSFFNGIGGALVALHRLGIRLKGAVSVEPCENKRRIVTQWWENTGQSGELIQVEDSQKLSSNKLEDLIKKFRGFDLVICQNPYASGDSTTDLAALDFSLFVEFVRVLQRVRTTMERNR